MARVVVEVVRAIDLDQRPRIHHRDTVADFRDEIEIVADEDHRNAALTYRLDQESDDLCLHRHVKRRRGFVGDDQSRLHGKRCRDHHALAHAAGKLRGIGIVACLWLRNGDFRQEPKRFCPGFLCRHAGADRRLCDLGADRAHRVETGDRLLKDQPDRWHLYPRPRTELGRVIHGVLEGNIARRAGGRPQKTRKRQAG